MEHSTHTSDKDMESRADVLDSRTETEKQEDRLSDVGASLDFLKNTEAVESDREEMKDTIRLILEPPDEADSEPGDEEGEQEKDNSTSEGIRPELMERARQLGIGEEQANVFKTNEALEAALSIATKSYSKEVVDPKEEEASVEDDTSEDINVEIDSDVVDPEVIAAFRELEKQANAKIAALRKKGDAQESKKNEEASGQRAQSTITSIDPLFKEVDEQYGGIFGEVGTLNSGVKESHRKIRGEVISRMMQLHKGMKGSGARLLTLKALFQESVNSLHADKRIAKNNQDGERDRKRTERNKQITSRPSRSRGSGDSVSKPKDDFESHLKEFSADFHRILGT